MWIRTLRLTNLRRFEGAELRLQPGPNLFLGPNGAGKTSLLEAAYLLSHGRSFRRGGREALLRRGAAGFVVFAEVVGDDGAVHRLGLSRVGAEWTARHNDEPIRRLSDLLQRCAVCCFEPGSHELISGPAEGRRAFMDWGVFHVERDFLDHWRRYQRALKQRNALLKGEAGDDELAPWNLEMAQYGTVLSDQRAAYLSALERRFQAVTAELLPELGPASLVADAGWQRGAAGDLAAQLQARQGYDRIRRTTTLGPHRADWRPRFEGAPEVVHLSRGQEKLTALAVVLAQAEHLHAATGEWPVLALDDLASELDAEHREAVVRWLGRWPAQVLLTGADDRVIGDPWSRPPAVFHVEPDGRLIEGAAGPTTQPAATGPTEA